MRSYQVKNCITNNGQNSCLLCWPAGYVMVQILNSLPQAVIVRKQKSNKQKYSFLQKKNNNLFPVMFVRPHWADMYLWSAGLLPAVHRPRQVQGLSCHPLRIELHFTLWLN